MPGKVSIIPEGTSHAAFTDGYVALNVTDVQRSGDFIGFVN
jgi:hypothetical protein